MNKKWLTEIDYRQSFDFSRVRDLRFTFDASVFFLSLWMGVIVPWSVHRPLKVQYDVSSFEIPLFPLSLY